jgi:hypothetical protein
MPSPPGLSRRSTRRIRPSTLHGNTGLRSPAAASPRMLTNLRQSGKRIRICAALAHPLPVQPLRADPAGCAQRAPARCVRPPHRLLDREQPGRHWLLGHRLAKPRTFPYFPLAGVAGILIALPVLARRRFRCNAMALGPAQRQWFMGLGAKVSKSFNFPLSDDWRQASNLSVDYSTRALALLRQFSGE